MGNRQCCVASRGDELAKKRGQHEAYLRQIAKLVQEDPTSPGGSSTASEVNTTRLYESGTGTEEGDQPSASALPDALCRSASQLLDAPPSMPAPEDVRHTGVQGARFAQIFADSHLVGANDDSVEAAAKKEERVAQFMKHSVAKQDEGMTIILQLGVQTFTRSGNLESAAKVVWRVLDFAGALVVQEEDGEDNVRSKAEIRRAQIWRGRAHGDLGQIYWESSDYWTAIEHFKCAAYLFRAANDHVREAKGRTKLMNIYAGTRECKTPLTFQDHEQAMEEAKRRMDLPQEADTGWQEAKAFLARSGVLH